MSETVTGVALLSEDGRMWALPATARHCHLFALAAFQGVDAEPCTQGFTTSAGRFVDRKTAYRVAAIAKRPMTALRASGELYSEDLW